MKKMTYEDTEDFGKVEDTVNNGEIVDLMEDCDESKTVADDVVGAFNVFLGVYNNFRRDHDLKSNKIDSFEICTAMLDKLGRIARQVKHNKRNDPKEDWPEGMTQAMTGLLVYMIILLDSTNVKIDKGMKLELMESVKQYKGKK